ncbi:MAG: cyclic nucleotide-binding domain-containing protein [Elusimicrobiota bacterium]
MDKKRNLPLLRSLELFSRFTDKRLEDLSAYLEPLSFEGGAEIFSEGSIGDGLYFVASGRVRVTKRLAAGGVKDIASLGTGDCFGEMALLDAAPRSAGAWAVGKTELVRLRRDDLKNWLAADAASAMDFFSALVSVQSERLRRTSSELALLHDLSSLLVEPATIPASLLSRSIERVLPHLEGTWSAAACVFNPYNNEMDPAGSCGPETFGPEVGSLPSPSSPALSWESDNRTLAIVLRSPAKLLATLRLRSSVPLNENRRAESARTMAAVAQLLTSALENMDFRADEVLRRRLQMRTGAQGL